MKFKDLEGLKPYEKVLVDSSGTERYFVHVNIEKDRLITDMVDFGVGGWTEESIKDWTFKEEKKEIVCFEFDDGQIKLTTKDSLTCQALKSPSISKVKQIPCPWEQQ